MHSCVIIVNWNGWKDTIECLESVLRLKHDSFRIIVCDNGSTDGSLDKIRAWAQGELLAEAANPELSRLISPPVKKPIAYSEFSREEAESQQCSYDSQFVVIRVGADLGYAGGNNVGLRYALGDPECEYFWILNNDVDVEPDALSAMIRVTGSQKNIGLCGSLNLSYYNPTEVQMEGGLRFNRWTARVSTPERLKVSQLSSEPLPMDYVNGASMLATRSFVEQVGLLDESYLIYFEELDWVRRAALRFSLGYARDSVIYHKEGAALGSSTVRVKRSLLAEKYVSRNRIVFTKRYFPWALPIVFAAVCAAAVERLLRRDVRRAALMIYWGFKGLIGDMRNSW